MFGLLWLAELSLGGEVLGSILATSKLFREILLFLNLLGDCPPKKNGG